MKDTPGYEQLGGGLVFQGYDRRQPIAIGNDCRSSERFKVLQCDLTLVERYE